MKLEINNYKFKLEEYYLPVSENGVIDTVPVTKLNCLGMFEEEPVMTPAIIGGHSIEIKVIKAIASEMIRLYEKNNPYLTLFDRKLDEFKKFLLESNNYVDFDKPVLVIYGENKSDMIELEITKVKEFVVKNSIKND